MDRRQKSLKELLGNIAIESLDLNLSKIDMVLALAFSMSDGPFRIIINKEEIRVLAKEEIIYLTQLDGTSTIELDRRFYDRRWRNRAVNP